MKNFLGFKTNPLRPIDFKDEKKWLREGDSYKLLSPDPETDKQFLPALFETKGAKQIGEDAAKQRIYISGIANANIVDRVQERLDPRGIMVVDYMKNPQLLAHHSYYCPIGQVEQLDIQDDGIHFEAWIGDPTKGDLTEMQEEIRSLVLQGILKTVSVGFIPRKIRAPLYSDQGELLEPMVIEQWELLEISIVAIPCNQDSVFGVKSFQTLKDLAKVNGKPSDTTLNESETEAGTKQNSVVENPDSGKDGLSNHSSEPISDLTEGVDAVKKKDDAAGPAEDNDETNYKKEVVTLLRSIAENSQKSCDQVDKMYQKMMEDDKPEVDPKPEDEKPEDEKEVVAEPTETSEATDVKALAERLESIEKDFKVMTESFKLLLDRLNIKAA